MHLKLSGERRALQRVAEEFASSRLSPIAAAIDEPDECPREIVGELGAAGLLGVAIGAEWGGMGRDDLDGALVIGSLARDCAAVASDADSRLGRVPKGVTCRAPRP